MVCDSADSIFKFLTEEGYQEVPVWTGKDDNSNYTLFANSKTGTWSIIQFDRDVACILGTGIQHKMVIQKFI